MDDKIADIIVNINHADVDKIFQYLIPKSLENTIEIGMRVTVPFGQGNKKIKGYVIELNSYPNYPMDKMKRIVNIIDKEPVFSIKQLELAKWMKKRYCSTLAACLNCIIPKSVDQKLAKQWSVKVNDKFELSYIVSKLNNKRMVKQLNAINHIIDNNSILLNDLKNNYNVSSYTIKALKNKEFILLFEDKNKIFNIGNVEKPYELNKEQELAVSEVLNYVDNNKFRSFLLHGVTGSGKTEVYMHIIKHVIDLNKQVIVLVPEISLTPQMVDRFRKRFGNLVGFTHSRLNSTEKKEQWIKAKNGEIAIMLGPRSAIFTPFNNLGLIIIDEEHETTYKSDLSPKYHTKEVALKICSLTNSVLLLGSATPSIDSFFYVKQGKISLLTLKQRAVAKHKPKIDIVDMRKEIDEGNMTIFSKKLYDLISDRLKNKQQIILFLNRRGFSTFVSCRKCGFVMKCSSCDLPFTYHATTHSLICHHCGKVIPMVLKCPQCGSKYIKYFGIGTQKVEAFVTKNFPQARVLRMDMDTTTKKNSHSKIYHQFCERKADILIGTQMIAKGFDFPYVTLVGVIAADMSLYTNDFRSSERTFQLLTQVAGRSGRASLDGEVIIQTYSPDHYSIVNVEKQDYNSFYNKEITYRKIMNYPPYSNIFTYLISGKDEDNVIKGAHMLSNILNSNNYNNQFDIIGPAPASLSKLKDNYRWRVIVKYNNYNILTKYCIKCLEELNKLHLQLKIGIDINPLIMN